MSKQDFEHGSATVKDFFYWINERHRIYVARFIDKKPGPWTKDPILQQYKFTNVFRQLDKGTLALRSMLRPRGEDRGPENVVYSTFNVIWYRMFNRYEHAKDVGFVRSFDVLKQKFRMLELEGKTLFTSAHMTTGRAFEAKVDTALSTLERVWTERGNLTGELTSCRTMEDAFKSLIARKYYGIGKFIAYEIISDLRWVFGYDFEDLLEWANIGPGCKRGLERLGMDVNLESLRKLYGLAKRHGSARIKAHIKGDEPPPFELREIEHSLCEFDKYMRVKTGAGRPRETFKPTEYPVIETWEGRAGPAPGVSDD